MKETIKQQIKWLAQYAGGMCDKAVLSDEDTETLMPKLMKALKEQSDAVGYDGFTGRPDDYPDMVWVMVYNGIVKPTVLEWIDANCPDAWFRMMYLSKEEQDRFMLEQQAQDMLDNPEDYGLI